VSYSEEYYKRKLEKQVRKRAMIFGLVLWVIVMLAIGKCVG